MADGHPSPPIRLCSVALLPEGRTCLPGQPPWHLGVVRLRRGPVALTDLGPMVGMDARCHAARYLLRSATGTWRWCATVSRMPRRSPPDRCADGVAGHGRPGCPVC